MVSRFLEIPDGRGHRRLGLGPQLVGHCAGEFARTRVRVKHYRKKRAKLIEKQKKDAAKASKAKATDGGAKGTKGGAKKT